MHAARGRRLASIAQASQAGQKRRRTIVCALFASHFAISKRQPEKRTLPHVPKMPTKRAVEVVSRRPIPRLRKTTAGAHSIAHAGGLGYSAPAAVKSLCVARQVAVANDRNFFISHRGTGAQRGADTRLLFLCASMPLCES